MLPDAEWLEEIDFSQWDVVLQMYAGTTVLKKPSLWPGRRADDCSGRGHYAAGYQRAGGISDHAAFSEPGLARLTGVKEMPVR